MNLRHEVYVYLSEHGPCSAREVYQHFGLVSRDNAVIRLSEGRFGYVPTDPNADPKYQFDTDADGRYHDISEVTSALLSQFTEYKLVYGKYMYELSDKGWEYMAGLD